MARAILDGTDNGMVYNDEAVCASNGVTMRETNDELQNEQEVNSVVIVTPNPASQIVNFNFSSNEKIIIKIYDSFGKIIFDKIVKDEGVFSLDISNLKNGVYQYCLHSIDNTINGSLVILH
jgi:NADH/NAD ratio-sensing transcriptional regulator Rex